MSFIVGVYIVIAKVSIYYCKQKNNVIFVLNLTVLRITFLGTGTSQGIPIIGSKHPVCLSDNSKDKRLRVSVLIEWDDYAFVVDCGPDFRQQMLRAKVSKIDGIIFTHEHADHTMGLDDIRPFFFRQGDIPLYAHKRVFAALEKRFDYIFTTGKKYPGVPSVTKQEIINSPFRVGNIDVTPIDGLHYKLQVFGFRFKDFI
jgi:phosphoribosyl 1,2-cyclic phosphate phosphodiesterase